MVWAEKYLEVKDGAAITASSILEDKRVKEALADANDNRLGVTFEVIVIENGINILKKDKSGNIIE